MNLSTKIRSVRCLLPRGRAEIARQTSGFLEPEWSDRLGRLQNVSKTRVASSGRMRTRENFDMSPNCCGTNVLDQKSRSISTLEKRVSQGSNPSLCAGAKSLTNASVTLTSSA